MPKADTSRDFITVATLKVARLLEQHEELVKHPASWSKNNVLKSAYYEGLNRIIDLVALGLEQEELGDFSPESC